MNMRCDVITRLSLSLSGSYFTFDNNPLINEADIIKSQIDVSRKLKHQSRPVIGIIRN